MDQEGRSTKTESTIKNSTASSTFSQYPGNKGMKELHKEFSKLNSGKSNPQKFAKKAKELGYTPTNEMHRVLNDPAPKFKNIVKTIGNFQKPKTQERLPTKFGGNHPRYTKKTDPKIGISKQTKIAVLQEFQRGNLTVDELQKKLGSESNLTGKDLDNIVSGDFTKVASKLVRNDELRAEKCSGVQNIDPIMKEQRKSDLRHRFGKEKKFKF